MKTWIVVAIIFGFVSLGVIAFLIYWFIVRKRSDNTTGNGTSVVCDADDKPAAVTDLTVLSTNSTTVNLSWTASTASNVLTYRIIIGNNSSIDKNTLGTISKSVRPPDTTFTYTKTSAAPVYFVIYTLTRDGCSSDRSLVVTA